MHLRYFTLLSAVMLYPISGSAFVFLEGSIKKITDQTGTFSASFLIYNDKKEPLIVKGIRPSTWRCSAHFGREPIFSNQASVISISCSDLEKGYFDKSFEVLTSQGNGLFHLVGQSDPSEEDKLCRDVRLDSPGGSMEHVRVRNQRRARICYAEAAAQTYDAWRFTHGETNYKAQTSAVELAFSFLDETGGVGGFGGNGYPGLKLMKYLQDRGGSCSEEYIGRKFPKASDLDFIGQLDAVFNSELKQTPDTLRCIVSQNCGSTENPLEHISDSAIDSLLNKRAFTAFMKTVTPIFCPSSVKLVSSSKFEVSGAAWSPDSSEDTHIEVYRSNFDIFNTHLLDPTSMPVLINVCSEMLKNGKKVDTVKCKRDHSVLITGMRKNPETGKCEVLVRNSWGKNCEPYSKDWACEKEKGSLWIDVRSINRARFKMTVVR